MYQEDMATFNVYVPHVYLEVLRGVAKDNKTSVSELMRTAIYETYGDEIDQKEAKQ
jgi:hypothetical protein